MKGTVFTKTIISIFILLLMQTQVCANPIPVFLFFGWIQKQNVSSSIYEIDYESAKYLKKYSQYGSSIYEIDYATDKNLKKYSQYGSSIYEIDYATDKNLKKYSQYGSSLYEIDCSTDKNLKYYHL